MGVERRVAYTDVYSVGTDRSIRHRHLRVCVCLSVEKQRICLISLLRACVSLSRFAPFGQNCCRLRVLALSDKVEGKEHAHKWDGGLSPGDASADLHLGGPCPSRCQTQVQGMYVHVNALGGALENRRYSSLYTHPRHRVRGT